MNQLQKQKIYEPITISLNPKFDSNGLNLRILQQLTLYDEPIGPSKYQNYIDQTRPYNRSGEIKKGLLFELKQFHAKVLICICMYNEHMSALQSTLNGIFKNLKYLSRIGIATSSIGVVVMQDGIIHCHESVIDYYSQMDQNNSVPYALRQRVELIHDEIKHAKSKKLFQRVVANDNFPETVPKKVSLLYQNRWRPLESKNDQGHLNLLSCFKHLNGKKLSSHAWFFQGFCKYVKPEFCILLDAGTVPQEDGVANLILGMQQNDRIGGVSGFMGIDINLLSNERDDGQSNRMPFHKGKQLYDPLFQKQQLGKFQKYKINDTVRRKNKLNLSEVRQNDNSKTRTIDAGNTQRTPIEKETYYQRKPIFTRIVRSLLSVEKAQQVQYIFSHFIDKNAESFTGFLHVLPGAWSGYRLSALQTSSTFEKDILQEKYFKTLIEPNLEQGESGYKFANMYLAEDRILSLAIYCHKQKYYYLKYIPNARAMTDPMNTHYDLIIQRRRWINSSNFAYKYVLTNYQYDFDDSNHSTFDLFLVKIGIFISSCSYFNVYFIPCFYLFVLYSTVRNNGWISETISQYIALIVSTIYVSVVLICIGGSMNGSEWIKQTLQKDENGKILKDSQKKPIKRQRPTNGPAIYISYAMAIITYFITFTVSSIIANIIYKGVLQFRNSGTVDQMSLFVFILMVINILDYLVILLIHTFTHPRQILSIIKGVLSYMTYQGVYTHTMVIYSFCNIHDVSWGTKGDSTKGSKKYERQRLIFVATWMFWNTILCFTFLFLDFIANLNGTQYILLILAVYSTGLLSLKTTLAIINHIKFYLCCCFKPKMS